MKLLLPLAALAIFLTHPGAISDLYMNLGVIKLMRRGYVTVVSDPSTSCPSGSALEINDFREALVWNRSNERAWTYSGAVRWMNGDCVGALADWKEATCLTPPSDRAWLLLGKGAFVSGDVDTAVTTLSKARAGPYLIALASHAPSVDDALRWNGLAVQVNPTVRSVAELAQRLLRLGKTDDAFGAWQRLADLTAEDNPEHWWALAEAAALRGNWARAAEFFHHGGELAGFPYAYLEREGTALRYAGDADGALRTLRQAIRANPIGVWAYWQAGDIEQARGNYGEAGFWYQAAVQAQPQEPLSNIYLAVLAFELGQYDRAADNLVLPQAACAEICYD